ncbi:MAG: DNA-formamidopyrimidine glycosylase [Dethiobacter sp.]|nr:DNA-formamidopyrimidine glycosylase [Dethiobacter sp.]MCL5983021.1 DNA-formamidopyrimidine glycosylase [Bacillota bacterium]
MPELPEVETIRRDLDAVLLEQIFSRVEIIYPGPVRPLSAEQFAEKLAGKKIISTGRRGKYLLLNLDDGSVIAFHLRMTGRLVFARQECARDKHTHLVFHFADGSCLTFSDVRKFGTIWLLSTGGADQIPGLSALGPEPLSGDFHFPYLDRALEKRAVSVKALLLDQRVVAGLGNIYADEVLHRACIRPERKARSLGREERIVLFLAIREVLEEAISCRGTTVSDYRDASGSSGMFQERLRVYGRRGELCSRCGEVICRSCVAGRGTYYCPRCQK